MQAWAQIYAAPKAHWAMYELAEKLVDLEYQQPFHQLSHRPNAPFL